MVIRLENIHSISESNWCRLNGKNLGDYELSRLHVDCRGICEEEILQEFAEQVPDNAEAVVGYVFKIRSTKTLKNYAKGTILVPKR